jgi:catechol 2,3-dioxygenase-like lactoylglutathione lyase family enzyme
MLRLFSLRTIITLLLVCMIAQTPSLAQTKDSVTTPPTTSIASLFQANHVALRVVDLEASVQWWKSVFGATEVRRSRIPNIDPGIEIAFLQIADGFHVELVGGGHPEVIPPPKTIAEDYQRTGYKHIGFLVNDLKAVLQHMAQFGVKPDYQIDRLDYGLRIALIREPNGYYVELYQPIKQR